MKKEQFFRLLGDLDDVILDKYRQMDAQLSRKAHQKKRTLRFLAVAASWQRQIFLGGKDMETRVAVMSIIVENSEMVEKLNGYLHEYGEWIIGRMGIPYRKRKISIIAVALEAPQNTISSLAGKVGSLPGISVKTAYSSIHCEE